MEGSLKQRLKDANGFVFMLVAVFALSSWIDIYGVFVEMPILVRYLPEGWSLPSYTGVITTIANIAPLIYILSNTLCPGNMKTRETFTIYFIIVSGAVTCILMSFFWDYTAHIAGAERSAALFAMVFFLSFVDCTSCVVFLPFMSRMKSVYMPSYIAGEEMGGMISGFVGLVQGIGGEPQCINVTKQVFNETVNSYYNITALQQYQEPPRFSVSFFFLFLFGMMCMSVIAFTLLNYSSYCKREMVKEDNGQTDREGEEMLEKINGHVPDVMLKDELKVKEVNAENPPFSECRFALLVFYFAYIAFFMYGLGPCILSFAVLPYGYFEYNLSIRLSTVINPLVALSTFFLQTSSTVVIGICTAIANGLSFFGIYMALMSPSPPLAGTTEGSIMVVSDYVSL